MRKLVEKILNELNFGGFLRKQRSVTRLFPEFPQRVANVNKKGGVRLNEMLPDGVWHFKVHSGTQDGLRYDIYMRFKNLPEMIKKNVANRKLWKKDESGVNYNELAAEIFNQVDLEMDCSCPADTFWGPEYIKTQRKAQYGHEERRPPRVRNPRQYGIQCKHAHDVFITLPFYVVTLGSYLKKYYNKEVTAAETELRGTLAQVKAGTEFLTAKQAEQE